jgi:hypothetical protein
VKQVSTRADANGAPELAWDHSTDDRPVRATQKWPRNAIGAAGPFFISGKAAPAAQAQRDGAVSAQLRSSIWV